MTLNRKEKDLYLPAPVLCLGVFLLIVAAVCIPLVFITSVFFLVAVIGCLLLGLSAILCWKNQGITMTGDNSFTYTTMFGREKRYSFSEIKELRVNSDSYTLIMEDGKVHIEKLAVISDRLAEALDAVLKNID